MKRFLLVTLWLTATRALCADFGTVDLTRDIQLQTDIRNRIEVAGFDCPKPLVYQEVGSDYRGKLYRVDCQSGNDGTVQSFRIVEQTGQPPRVERW
jgi:hypothetical protein